MLYVMKVIFEPLLDVPKGVKVVVAMSGGVDSSFVASQLCAAGYNVIGVTMQLRNSCDSDVGSCCTGSDIKDARSIASFYGFPHYVLNYSETFENEVVNYFRDSYANGETPVPCIKCNQTVKFRDLLRFSDEIGASILVTGHYARVKKIGDSFSLLKAKDLSKDQSYFLFTMTERQLQKVRFPIGNFLKSDVRTFAKETGLEVADKPDSQDICFVQSKYTELFTGTMKKGNIVHVNGEIVGEHSGIENFTVGQRRGIGVSWSEPLYVLKLNKLDNLVIVGSEDLLFKSRAYIKDVTWISDQFDSILSKNSNITAKLRASHSGVAVSSIRSLKDGVFEVVFSEPQKAVSAGQACVFYNEDIVLGGGWLLDFDDQM